MANSTTTLGVVSAIFGDFDLSPPLPPGFDFNVLVTDRPVETGWTNVVVSNPIESRLASKLPKMRPDLFLSADILVWIDANFRESSPGWLSEAARGLPDSKEFALFPHPRRSTVAEEVEVAEQLFKARDYPLREQYATYLKEGFTDSEGLWHCAVMVRRNTVLMREFGTEWLWHNLRWSLRDQISFPYVLQKFGIQPHALDLAVRRSGQVFFIEHKIDDYSHPTKTLPMPSRLFKSIRGLFGRQ